MIDPKAFPYTPEECQLLIDQITDSYYAAHPEQCAHNLPMIIYYLKQYIEKGEIPYLNQRHRRIALRLSVDDMPIHINNRNQVSRCIAIWRLKINK